MFARLFGAIPEIAEGYSHHLPNHGVSAVQMKNWDPLVLGPALAMDRTPFPTWGKSKFSSIVEWKERKKVTTCVRYTTSANSG